MLASLYGFLRLLPVPGMSYQETWDVAMKAHGDDFLLECDEVSLCKLGDVVLKNFLTKVLPRMPQALYRGRGNVRRRA